MTFSRPWCACVLSLAFAGGFSSLALAQAENPSLPLPTTQESKPDFTPLPVKDSGIAAPAPAATGSGSEAYPLERWLDMKAATFSLRYRNVADTNGAHEYEQGSQRTIADGKFKFDAAGKYSLGFHISSGHYFDWAYADFAGGGLDKALTKTEARLAPDDLTNLQNAFINYPNEIKGLRSGGWSLYFRRLYLDAKPIKAVEFQVGSLDIDRGAGSEITTYDDDAYIDGERILLHAPKQLFFDQVSFTYAYLGDIFQPNFFSRMGRMGQGNYRQYMVRKAFGKRLDVSADFTDTRNLQTFHEAAFVRIPEAKVVDAVRVETYQRLAPSFFDNFQYDRGSGFAITASKRIGKRFDLDAGVANLDWNFDVYTHLKIAAILGYSLNGDGYNTGQHWFVRPTLHLTKEFSASAFYSRMFNYDYNADGYLWNRSNLQVGVSYNFTDLFHKGASLQ